MGFLLLVSATVELFFHGRSMVPAQSCLSKGYWKSWREKAVLIKTFPSDKWPELSPGIVRGNNTYIIILI